MRPLRLHRVQVGGLEITQLFFNILLDLVLLIIPLAVIVFIERRPLVLSGLGFQSRGVVNDSLLTLKIFAALVIFSVLFSIALSFSGINDIGKVEDAVGAIFSYSPLWLMYFMVVRVFAEEFFFRAFLVPRIGVMGSSIAFAIAHLGYGSVAEVLGALVLGAILAIAYKENRQIVPNYMAHLLYNVVALAAFLQA